ncbi:hypothetical protein MTO96_037419 [Rhipicephalus appendiculatus]
MNVAVDGPCESREPRPKTKGRRRLTGTGRLRQECLSPKRPSKMENIPDPERLRRLQELERSLLDHTSEIHVDGLLDAVQALVMDCNSPALRRMKNIDSFLESM